MFTAAHNPQPARLKFTDHIMFNAVLTENEELCARLIGAVLGKHVEHVEYLDDEVSIQPSTDGHGARLDVLALIDGEYVDVEMQVGREPDIARRCRFYHSAIASRYTPKGSDYKGVPTSYVIFICLNDPLGAGYARYELATCCTNNPDVLVDDGSISILLNARAWEHEENPEVAGMLKYALTGHSSGQLAESLANAVDGKNLDRKWVKASMGVMTYEHEMRVLNHELEERRAIIEQQSAQIEQQAVQIELQAAQIEQQSAQLEQQRAELEQQRAEIDALRIMLDKLIEGSGQE